MSEDDKRIMGDDIFGDAGQPSHQQVPPGAQVIQAGPEAIWSVVSLILKDGGTPQFMKWLSNEGLQAVKAIMIETRLKETKLKGNDSKCALMKMSSAEHAKYIKLIRKVLTMVKGELGQMDTADAVIIGSLILEMGIMQAIGVPAIPPCKKH